MSPPLSSFKWAGALDMYRKVPTDLMEGTKRGSVLSITALLAMAVLFSFETMNFFQKQLITDLALDSKNKDPRLRLNFNITMMDLKCDYTVVDVVSVLGTQQNVSSHVTKWNVDATGIRQRYQGRNKLQHDIELFDPAVTTTLDQLYVNGEDAISLDPQTFEFARKEQEYLFVDFYATWCSHCQKLAPTWEALAEVMTAVAENIVAEKMPDHHFTDEDYDHAKKVELPVMIAKVDCVTHPAFCTEHNIMAYPTLRLFVDGERWRAGDYRGDRTVVQIADYLKQIEDVHKSELESNKARNVELAHETAKELLGGLEQKGEDASAEEFEWADKVKRRKQRLHNSWVDEEHPGCQLSGHLLLDRVPGNFHIQARSPHHDLVPHMTNVSHVIHHLSIGDPIVERLVERGNVFVPDQVKKRIAPMDSNAYITQELHEAYHHYLKVVTTNVDGLKVGKRELKAYQIIQSSQLSYYRNDVIPEAKFIIDLSPIAVSYWKRSRHWYDYLTSVMAIVGGTFTFFGLLESTLNAALTRKKLH